MKWNAGEGEYVPDSLYPMSKLTLRLAGSLSEIGYAGPYLQFSDEAALALSFIDPALVANPFLNPDPDCGAIADYGLTIEAQYAALGATAVITGEWPE
jgi:hypothetical protein